MGWTVRLCGPRRRVESQAKKVPRGCGKAAWMWQGERREMEGAAAVVNLIFWLFLIGTLLFDGSFALGRFGADVLLFWKNMQGTHEGPTSPRGPHAPRFKPPFK